MVVFISVNETATTEIYTYGPTLALHGALPQRRVFGHRFRHPRGQMAGEFFEAVAGNEMEAGGIAHAAMMPERGRTSRYEEVRALALAPPPAQAGGRSEEHTSALQSLMRISYAVLCLKKNNKNTITI